MRENGPLVELNTLEDPLSRIFGLGTSKYIIIPSMVFGCSGDMLELCPVLAQTPVRDLFGLPKILEVSDFCPNFRKNMVSYPPPPTHKYPKNPFLGDFEKVKHTAPYRTTFFRKSARTEIFMLVRRIDPPPIQPPYIHTHTYIYPLIYTPLPNSRWLHHTALKYARRVQFGAYMWHKGLKWVKLG